MIYLGLLISNGIDYFFHQSLNHWGKKKSILHKQHAKGETEAPRRHETQCTFWVVVHETHEHSCVHLKSHCWWNFLMTLNKHPVKSWEVKKWYEHCLVEQIDSKGKYEWRSSSSVGPRMTWMLHHKLKIRPITKQRTVLACNWNLIYL